MGKSIWLNEHEIGDLIWRDWENDKVFPEYQIFPDKQKQRFREFNIGRGRVDFACFNKLDGGHTQFIELFELKITASSDSVIQLIKYKRDLKKYLRQVFGECFDQGQPIMPKLYLNLVARYFDSKIIELCTELDINLWRVEVLSKDEINLQIEFDLINDEVPKDDDMGHQLKSFFGGVWRE